MSWRRWHWRFILCMDFKAVSNRWDCAIRRYTPAIEKTGYLFGIGVPLLFAIIPVFLYITQL